MGNEDYYFIPTGNPNEYEIVEKKKDPSDVLNDVWRIIHTYNEPQETSFDVGYDEGASWAVYEIAKRLGIELEGLDG